MRLWKFTPTVPLKPLRHFNINLHKLYCFETKSQREGYIQPLNLLLDSIEWNSYFQVVIAIEIHVWSYLTDDYAKVLFWLPSNFGEFFSDFFPLKDSNWPELSFPRVKVLIYWFSDTSLKVVPPWTRSWSLIEMKLRLIALYFQLHSVFIFIVLDCIGRFCSMGHAHCTLQKVIKLHYLIAQKNNFLMKTIVCGSRRPGVLWCYEWQLNDCQWQKIDLDLKSTKFGEDSNDNIPKPLVEIYFNVCLLFLVYQVFW